MSNIPPPPPHASYAAAAPSSEVPAMLLKSPLHKHPAPIAWVHPNAGHLAPFVQPTDSAPTVARYVECVLCNVVHTAWLGINAAGVVTLTIRDVPTSTYARTHTLMPIQPSIIAGHHILCYPGSREDLVRYPPRAVWTQHPPGNPTAATAAAQYAMGPSAAPSHSPATLHLQIALGSATAGMQEHTHRATAPQAGPYPAPRQQEQGPSHHMQAGPSSAVVQGRSTRTDDARNARPAPGTPYPPTHAAGTTKSRHAPPTSNPPPTSAPPAAPAAPHGRDMTPAERAADWSKYLTDVLLLSKRGPDGAPPQLPARVVAQELGQVLGEIEAHRDEMNVEVILRSRLWHPLKELADQRVWTQPLEPAARAYDVLEHWKTRFSMFKSVMIMIARNEDGPPNATQQM
ncbi:uncharacterized protein TRAVEDRAFT_18440 [Trametes versicolor FP-101664 SS1]|uniref:uncharacterized protein n=1 Tax=Trametes versicolor (strain FP-101664) TaxID=717944 RepID=UPI0004621CD6|nr:uncharacterized protein TRAVEDRAFT_18440 [Trametes versicolor FP-101664 SS1]EIW61889.1 hypothetical protein TRAVEDRAFT_18440 [Trametes versicolor FP-101664 SS1]